MAGFRMSASAGSSGEESGRAALARVGLAGSFFECFAGSRSGRFAMAPIWVGSGGGEFLGGTAGGLIADRGEVFLEGRRLDRPVDRRVELVDDRPRHARGRDDA